METTKKSTKKTTTDKTQSKITDSGLNDYIKTKLADSDLVCESDLEVIHKIISDLNNMMSTLQNDVKRIKIRMGL